MNHFLCLAVLFLTRGSLRKLVEILSERYVGSSVIHYIKSQFLVAVAEFTD